MDNGDVTKHVLLMADAFNSSGFFAEGTQFLHPQYPTRTVSYFRRGIGDGDQCELAWPMGKTLGWEAGPRFDSASVGSPRSCCCLWTLSCDFVLRIFKTLKCSHRWHS